MASSVHYLDVHHVSDRLNIPERTVRHLASQGRLPGVKIGLKIWYFRRCDIEEMCTQSHDSEER